MPLPTPSTSHPLTSLTHPPRLYFIPPVCQILEPIIKEEAGLTREMVKHLAQIEESVLEYLAWLSESPLFDAIDAAGKVPTFEEVHPFVVPTTPLANRGGPPFSSRIAISPIQSNPRLGMLLAARGEYSHCTSTHSGS